ncbi:DUF3575 domain-containing protein [Psychroflexus salis]|uniref:DUF3575 domain-containing protein n=1 Tax=Psychroflexus salis TaxID=1526574 RepID=A0A917E8K9_9FLAO|nr:DUF3575 domain-containing protein [Psychroflexus salis]GGE14828.1 hypothetical protein GCM10010831_15170 [Psychroflexus salis]
MKILHLLFTLLLCIGITNAQEKDYEKTGDDPVHELKVNVAFLILGNTNLMYENILNEESSIGASVSFPFDDFVSWDLNFSATAFYRFYFGDGYAKGIFAEGFGMFNNYDERIKKRVNNQNVRVNEDINDFALGLGGGYKMVSKGGVSLEFHIGIGRNLFNYGKDGRTFNFVPRGGIHVGYQF